MVITFSVVINYLSLEDQYERQQIVFALDLRSEINIIKCSILPDFIVIVCLFNSYNNFCWTTILFFFVTSSVRESKYFTHNHENQ